MILKIKKHDGFSLLEVLIATLVITIGFLGIASIQLVSMNNIKSASNRGIASILAGSMASSIHANSVYWSSAAVPAATINVNGSVISDATLNGQTNGGGQLNCNAANCNSAQMASYDLKTWGISMAAMLPSGAGSVRCAIAANITSCTIGLSWNENTAALNGSTNGSNITAGYQMVIQP